MLILLLLAVSGCFQTDDVPEDDSGSSSDEGDQRRRNSRKRMGHKRQRKDIHGDAKTRRGGGRGGDVLASRATAKQGWGLGKKAAAQRANDKYSGSSFKSKKASGDVTRKGQKLEPFAYIPLDAKAMSGG